MRIRSIESGAFFVLLLVTTVAFVWLLRALLQPVFWAAVLAVLFHPVQRRWLRVLGGRASAASALSLLSLLVIVIAPLFGVGFAVAREAVAVYERIAARQIDVQAPIRWIRDRVPVLVEELGRIGLEVERIEEAVSSAALAMSRFIAAQAITVGQDALRIALLFMLMLYVLYFFLRDGTEILAAVVRALPLARGREQRLFSRFVEVSRATIKGTLVIGIIQGVLGGLLFWAVGIPAAALWGAVMGVLSILPAVGAFLVWLPAGIVLILTGQWVRGLIVLAAGALVVSFVDNILRPILVGRDTRMPDYLILVSTLGGLSLFGITGLVLGPLIAALFLAVWEMFAKELAEERGEE